MKLFFEKYHKIPKPTTVECLNMLEEERHHTDFLEPFKKDVFNFIMEMINNMISNKGYELTRVFTKDNEYCDQLIVNVKLNLRDDWSNRRHTNGTFYGGRKLMNGKLPSPVFDIEVGLGKNGEVSDVWVNLIVDHEMNHLYDEWQWQTTGHEPLTDNTEWNHGDGKFIQENMGNEDNKLLQSLACCVYLSLWTETNAYINQAFKEFEHVKMKPRNVHQKIKTTVSYRNYYKQMIDLRYRLNKCTEEEAREVVNNLFRTYGRISIPKPKANEEYKNTLIKWSEGIYNRFMKRYCGIASLYLERNFDKYNK